MTARPDRKPESLGLRATLLLLVVEEQVASRVERSSAAPRRAGQLFISLAGAVLGLPPVIQLVQSGVPGITGGDQSLELYLN